MLTFKHCKNAKGKLRDKIKNRLKNAKNRRVTMER